MSVTALKGEKFQVFFFTWMWGSGSTSPNSTRGKYCIQRLEIAFAQGRKLCKENRRAWNQKMQVWIFGHSQWWDPWNTIFWNFWKRRRTCKVCPHLQKLLGTIQPHFEGSRILGQMEIPSGLWHTGYLISRAAFCWQADHHNSDKFLFKLR